MLQPADILVVRSTGLYGRAVQFAYRRAGIQSDLTHVALYLGNGSIVEADPPRVVERPLHYPQGLYRVVRYPQLTDEQRAGICAAAREQVGDRYDFAAIAEIAADLLLGLRIPVRQVAGARYCVSVVQRAYADAGVLLPDCRLPCELVSLPPLEEVIL